MVLRIETKRGVLGVEYLVLPGTTATAFLIGDAVFMTTATGLINKSTVVADYAGRIGIVCGGPDTDFKMAEVDTLIGTSAKAGGDTRPILVAINGSYWCIADETMASSGSPVGIGAAITTAGRLKTTAPVAGRILGIKLSLETEAAGTAVPIVLARS